MNLKLVALAALLLAPGQAMAEDIRVDCVPDRRAVCRDDEATCRAPSRPDTYQYHLTFDLTKKTGSLVFCSPELGCIEPSPLTVVYDYCGFLRDDGATCLKGGIALWERTMQHLYVTTGSQYVMTYTSVDPSGYGLSITEFGRCVVQ